MGFIDGLFKNVGNAVTGGLAGAAGNFVSGLFSDKDNPKEIMELQNQLEKERMKYQSDLNESAADRNQQRALEYFNQTAEYNNPKNQRRRLEEAGLNIGLMYGNAGQAGGSGATGGGTEQGVSAITPQGVSMGLQLEQLRLQNELAKAEIGKTAAEGEKIKEETKKTGTETKDIEQRIEESKTRIKDIIAGIPAKEQQYYVEKANQELMESMKELNETIKSVNVRKEKNMELESHVILKQYSKLESEIENLEITNELKRETKDLIKKRITSEINLTNARAMESIANAKFTDENIKTIDAKIKDWASQVEFRSENVKLEKEKIENQVKQWIKEFGLEEEKFEKEKMEAIVNGIFEAIKIAHGLGAGFTMGKFTKV